jgi:hypothetical protein
MITDLPKPDYARNISLIGYSEQGGRPDGVQIMVHRGYAYIGHMFSKGFSVLDVRDPTRPTAVSYLAAPPGTWNIHLQTHDDLLLVINAEDMNQLPAPPAAAPRKIWLPNLVLCPRPPDLTHANARAATLILVKPAPWSDCVHFPAGSDYRAPLHLG